MKLEEFNALSADDAAAALQPCLDVPRWVSDLVAARPYPSRESLSDRASGAAEPLTDSELERALSHHPRIGERHAGAGAEAAFSQREQSGIHASDATATAIAEGNRAYDQKFGQVFLIRAAGRSGEEILAELTRRLGNSPDDERVEVDRQLHEIAVLRIERVVSA